MKTFEYKTIQFDAKGAWGGKIDEVSMQRELNIYGAQGWELVSMTASNQSYGSTRWIICVFKREL